jgi:hypothetical protein
LLQVHSGEARSVVQVADPCVVVQRLSYRTLFLPCFAEKEWREVLWPKPMQPARRPEWCPSAIADGNCSASRKEESVTLSAGDLHAHPSLLRGGPLVPEPSEPEGRRKPIKIKDPQTPKFRRKSRFRPIDLAITTRKRLIPRPKEAPANLVNRPENVFCWFQHREIIDRLQG